MSEVRVKLCPTHDSEFELSSDSSPLSPDNPKLKENTRAQELWSYLRQAVANPKQLEWLKQRLGGAVPTTNVIKIIYDFLLQTEPIDIDVIRKSLHHQMKRADMRLRGVQNMLQVLYQRILLPSVEYALLSGWQGITIPTQQRIPVPHTLSMVNLIPPCDRVLLEAAFSDLTTWTLNAFRKSLITAKEKLNNLQDLVRYIQFIYIYLSDTIQINFHKFFRKIPRI